MRHIRILGAALLLMALSACASEETPVTGVGDANSAAPVPDSISGTWTGDWGATPAQRTLVTLALNWDGKTLGGSVDPGPNAVAITKGSFAPDTGMLTLEATGNGPGGKLIQYSVEGKLAEGAISGTWTQDGKKGDFRLTRK
jgi:hypothetical protein